MDASRGSQKWMQGQGWMLGGRVKDAFGKERLRSMLRILTLAVSGLSFTVTSDFTPHRKHEWVLKTYGSRSTHPPNIRIADRTTASDSSRRSTLRRYAAWPSTAEGAKGCHGEYL